MAKNRKIEAMFAVGMDLHIEPLWGLGQFARYRHECDLIESDRSGEVMAEIKERRIASRSQFIDSISMAGLDPEERESLGDGVIAVLNLSGTMQLEGGISSRGVSGLIQDLQEADADPTVIGAIVDVNSGGGQSLAGNALFQAVDQFSKPIVALANFMGSAAVNGMLPADSIIMNGVGAEAGSIGSYVSIDNEFLAWYKDNVTDIYAEGSEGKNREFRELIKGNSGPMQSYVNESAAIFRAKVAEHRPLAAATQAETLSGGMFYASDAVERGLADRIGNMRDAVAEVVLLAKEAPGSEPTEPVEDAELDAMLAETESMIANGR